MKYNQETKQFEITGSDFVIIYPFFPTREAVAVDFYHSLSYLKANGILYRWLKYDLSSFNEKFIEPFENSVIYLYISDITYLDRLRNGLDKLKKNKPFIIIGGSPAITVKAFDILSLFVFIDVIIREPESAKALVNFFKGIRKGKDLASLEGITFRQKGTDKIIKTPNLPLSKDLDELYDCEFLEQTIPTNSWYPLVTSRGCSYNCQYCGLQVPYRMNYNGVNSWRARTVKKIVDEIERSISRGINKFAFYSEQVFNPKDAACVDSHPVQIAHEIIKRKLKPQLTLIAKASELLRNFESLLILRDAGLETVDVGIDSGFDRFHRFYRTGSSVRDNLEILKRMHEYRFNFSFSFVFFDPYITISEIEKNLEFLEKVSVYFSHLPRPYSAYLDSGILNSVLILRHGIPIIRKLRQDNLIVEYRGFSKHPEIKFKDSRVEKIYSIYRIIKKNVIPSIRPSYNNKLLLEKNPSLNLLPLKIIREVVIDVAEERAASIPGYVLEKATYLRNLPVLA